MNYNQALEKILSIPMFQNVGVSAFIPTLDGSIRLNTLFGNPYNSYPTIHVAGTNGKGSTSSMLTSILMEAGYKVGCYTSPHLLDYRERVRINGVNVSEEIVCDFMDRLGDAIDQFHPSFFEVTTALAFYAFQRENVDIAVIETGLGGLTDSTNVITPILSVITNIGFDHKYLLGNTKTEIAVQKGGIIKEGVPVVIGEHGEESDVVFLEIAASKHADIVFAQDVIRNVQLKSDLTGEYQQKNLVTALSAVEKLREGGVVSISVEAVKQGLLNVCRNTSFEGRWQKIAERPLTICDTGHNEDGLRYVTHQLSVTPYDKLYIVLGFMADKEVSEILRLFPVDAHYLFARASNPRSMSGEELQKVAAGFHLHGEAFGSVAEAYVKAKEYAGENDMIFIGGSTFIVADLMMSKK